MARHAAAAQAEAHAAVQAQRFAEQELKHAVASASVAAESAKVQPVADRAGSRRNEMSIFSNVQGPVLGGVRPRRPTNSGQRSKVYNLMMVGN